MGTKNATYIAASFVLCSKGVIGVTLLKLKLMQKLSRFFDRLITMYFFQKSLVQLNQWGFCSYKLVSDVPFVP